MSQISIGTENATVRTRFLLDCYIDKINFKRLVSSYYETLIQILQIYTFVIMYATNAFHIFLDQMYYNSFTVDLDLK